jgi:transcriptional regulator with XRE-family HTH domain
MESTSLLAQLHPTEHIYRQFFKEQGITQLQLAHLLQRQGIRITQPELSAYLRGFSPCRSELEQIFHMVVTELGFEPSTLVAVPSGCNTRSATSKEKPKKHGTAQRKGEMTFPRISPSSTGRNDRGLILRKRKSA